MRITIACPEALIADARHLAMVLGYGPADAETYREANWRDAAGNLYAVASTLVFDGFVGKATTALERPDWDEEPYAVNMAAARRSQAALVFIADPHAEGVVTAARPDKLTAIPLDDPQAALALLGVSPVVESP
ncbi:hypothetical protein FAZ78_08990 [Cereibacter changlensis]|uniref:Uncharacterized protein n=1 Tax=Cereibacter changlensis TaxID=402884 RepID=A0A4V5NP00_9RHOB|nr:hypothetical protein [Cereibacter changlensis]TKA96897.1 hypothetical protein FAZ78_08990 [Cereibacter changlensis]